MSLRQLFVFTPLILVLSACQQAAWKMGASADDLKRDEQICRNQSDDDAAIQQCLRSKGWTVTDYSVPVDDNAAASVASATDNAATADNITTNTTTPTPTKTSAPRALPSGTTAPPTTINSGTAKTNIPDVKRAPADPLQRLSVQTWWKAGAQAADFNLDAKTCLDKLGELHAPDYNKRLYTRAMVDCLRERGWYSGRDPVYTPLR